MISSVLKQKKNSSAKFKPVQAGVHHTSRTAFKLCLQMHTYKYSDQYLRITFSHVVRVEVRQRLICSFCLGRNRQLFCLDIQDFSTLLPT